MAVLGGGALSYERGTPVGEAALEHIVWSAYDLPLGPAPTQLRWACNHSGCVVSNNDFPHPDTEGLYFEKTVFLLCQKHNVRVAPLRPML